MKYQSNRLPSGSRRNRCLPRAAKSKGLSTLSTLYSFAPNPQASVGPSACRRLPSHPHFGLRALKAHKHPPTYVSIRPAYLQPSYEAQSGSRCSHARRVPQRALDFPLFPRSIPSPPMPKAVDPWRPSPRLPSHPHFGLRALRAHTFPRQLGSPHDVGVFSDSMRLNPAGWGESPR
jgi:hypothetical protein